MPRSAGVRRVAVAVGAVGLASALLTIVGTATDGQGKVHAAPERESLADLIDVEESRYRVTAALAPGGAHALTARLAVRVAAATAARVAAEARASAEAAAVQPSVPTPSGTPGRPSQPVESGGGNGYQEEDTVSGQPPVDPLPVPDEPEYVPGPPIVIQMPPIIGPQQPDVPTYTFGGG